MVVTNLQDLKDWIGRTEEVADTITPGPVRKLAATLNKAREFKEGDVLPAAWHWMFGVAATPLAETGPDGHAKRGGFLPPVPLPRRMWAGGRLRYLQALRIGETIHKKSTVADVTVKEGKTGTLVFVLVRHEFRGAAGVALVEEQDIVYRELSKTPTAPAPKAAPAVAQWSRDIMPDPVLLFRYSALTFNGHRIHYDRAYCREVEDYPGLVVHGPLTATLLLELLQDYAPDKSIKTFAFRAVSPLFDTHAFRVQGRIEGDVALLWALKPEGHLAMEGEATLI